MQAMLPLIDREECNQPAWHNFTVDDSMVCAGYEEGELGNCYVRLKATATFRLRNDLYCVEWGVKLYSLTHVTATKYYDYISRTHVTIILWPPYPNKKRQFWSGLYSGAGTNLKAGARPAQSAEKKLWSCPSTF